jgi:hypothetical protein
MVKAIIQIGVNVKFLHHNATGQPVYLQKEAFNSHIPYQTVELEIPEDILTTFRNLFGSNTLILEVEGSRQLLQGEALDSSPRKVKATTVKTSETRGPEFYSEIGSKGGSS